MKLLLGLGKLLAMLFWTVVLVNLFKPLTNPFHLLVNLVGSLLLLVHLLELVLFNASVKHRAHPWRDRLLILLLGMFHIKGLPAPTANQDNKDANHA
ncbi:MAG: DUF1145 domain-containing protein [Pseudomonas sp.]|uniref:DUF1145 domain-containing protein n=1 Tax=unclassified Pseudomonas TaxID=196821 RepID=UPI001C68D01B|nr:MULTISPECIES: DUF1145 domain-containing protein [unclassified Pseudomonas]MDP2145862.1 DUF1145 domain-containing protein [Pseudomonas sp.]QYM70103.1 DUF1145 domain-containing protein [Pseudomonas sp. So3.2b]WLI35877.1 DUF1145 domain-containing protein [Pseudomonas sp. FP818]